MSRYMSVSGEAELVESLGRENGECNQGALIELRFDNATDAGIKVLANSICLPRLHTLDLQGDLMTDAGIEALAKSPNLLQLQNLRLDGKQITDDSIGGIAKSPYLPELQTLRLQRAVVTMAGIEALAKSPYPPKLRSLLLENVPRTESGFESLTKSLRLPHLQHVLEPELEFAKSSTSNDLLVYLLPSGRTVPFYCRAARSGPLLEVKVPILGLGALGKSLLSRRLVSPRDEYLFNRDNPATHAFETCGSAICRYGDQNIRTAELYRSDLPLCKLRLFDFGGQPELHGAHRFFLAGQRNVYVIVISARLTREDNRLDYWLRMVKHLGGNSPVVVVVSHCDNEPGADRLKRSREHVLQELDSEQLSSQNKMFVQVVDGYSNVHGNNFGDIREAIQRAILSLKAIFDVPFDPDFFALADWLTGSPANSLSNPSVSPHFRNVANIIGAPTCFLSLLPMFKDYATVDDFRLACEMVGQRNRQHQDNWLGVFRDLGYILYVGDRTTVKRHVGHPLSNFLFHPEWVKKTLYDLIRLDQARSTGGIVSGRVLLGVMRQNELSDEGMRLLMSLFLECALIFEVPGGDPEMSEYLIPDQVIARPSGVKLDWTNEPKRRLRWSFRFLPDYLLAQLVGYWFDHQPEKFTYYRDDVVLSRRGIKGRVRICADFNAHTLHLEFDQDAEKLKAVLESDLESLLDPEGVLLKPLWKEDDLTKPPEPIDEEQVSRISHLLLVLAKTPAIESQMKAVVAVVHSIFEQIGDLKPAEVMAYRVCMLYAYSKADLVLVDLETPTPYKQSVEQVLGWLDGAGSDIKFCLKEKFKLCTLESRGSFQKSYGRACKKLGISFATPSLLPDKRQRPRHHGNWDKKE